MCENNIEWKCRLAALINFTLNQHVLYHQKGKCVDQLCTMKYSNLEGAVAGSYKFREVEKTTNDISYVAYEYLKDKENSFKPFHVHLN